MSGLPRPADSVVTEAAPRSRPRAQDSPAFDAEYLRARLREQRLLIRVACTFGAVMTSLRVVEQLASPAWNSWQPMALAFVFALSLLLALIVWTPAFERVYLPVANLAVPVRNAVAAAFIAGVAAGGQPEMLMFLPLMILGPAFFLGLSWRAGVVSGLVTCLSFGIGAYVFALELPVVARTGSLLLLALAGSTIVARHLDALNRNAYRESHRIADLARQDALTGLRNRRVFDEQLAELWQQATDARQSLAILLLDVDYFKNYNDRFGHQAGDQELCRVAACLDALMQRPIDVLARYGGEEFAVILYDVSAETAVTMAETMRRAVSDGDEPEHQLPVLPDSPTATISIGVACVEPSADRQPRGAVQLADQALYEAKRCGRNRVVLKDPAAHRMLETGIFARSAIVREA